MRRLLSAALLGLVLASSAAQSAWPDKVVRIVVPFAPGALTDVAARALALELSEQLGQQFVVENRGGAGGTLGADQVAKSAPDGHTLVFTDNSYMISAGLYSKLPYDPLKDLVPVTLAVDAPAIMVAKLDLQAKSLRDVIALAKAKPRTLTFGSGGQGSSAHLATELLFNEAGVELVHIPFRGVAAALAETVGGRIDVTISSVGSAVGHIKSGRLRPLALSSAGRYPLMPEVPTVGETLKGVEFSSWLGLAVAPATPRPVIELLNRETRAILAEDETRTRFAGFGGVPAASSPEQMRERVELEIVRWQRVVQTRKIEQQ